MTVNAINTAAENLRTLNQTIESVTEYNTNAPAGLSRSRRRSSIPGVENGVNLVLIQMQTFTFSIAIANWLTAFRYRATRETHMLDMQHTMSCPNPIFTGDWIERTSRTQR